MCIRDRDYAVMHKKTRAQLEKLLLMLKDEGEEKTFAYIRKLLRHRSVSYTHLDVYKRQVPGR